MSEREISVAPARTEDLKATLAIFMDSVLGTYFDRETAESLLRAGLKQTHLFVARSLAEIVGFYLTAPAGAFLVFPYLHLLAVKTAVRGLGIGRALLRDFEARCLAAPGYPFRPKAFLLVAEANPRAVDFYKRCGYTRIAVIEDMFAKGDTEFLMMRDLGPKPGFTAEPDSDS